MNRLPFRLPEWTRVAWVTEPAKAVWEPRVRQVTDAWNWVEKESVGKIRPSGLFFVGPEEIPAFRAWCDSHKLSMLPLRIEADGGKAQYSAVGTAHESGPWRARTIACEPALATRWQEAYFSSDEAAIGELLGYPACCTAFFRKFWVAERWMDTTFPMAANSGVGYFERKSEPKVSPLERNFDVCLHRTRMVEEGFVVPPETPPESNILLRWMWLRLVPHLPCSFSCAATAEFGKAFAELGRKLGKSQEVDWLYEMLSWPIEWSQLHGIAEIKTPVFKVSTSSDPSAHRWTVQKEGSLYPAEGATGVVFPYRKLSSKKVTDSKSFQRAIQHEPMVHADAPVPVSESWNDNGFGSEAAETEAHAVLKAAAREVGDMPFDVIDLGCGNGKLVADLGAKGRAFGVESMPDRAARAAERLGADRVQVGSLFGLWPVDGPFGLVLFMPGRLLEDEGKARRVEFLSRLAGTTNRLLLYAYGDWLQKHGSIEALAREAGFGDWHFQRSHVSSNAQALLALKYVEHDHRCSGACCEKMVINGGKGLADLRKSQDAARARVAAGDGKGYDFDWDVIVPALEVVQEPSAADPKWYYRCRHHDKEKNLCTIFETRPKMCREYPSYVRGGVCGTCGHAPLVQLRHNG